MQSYRFYFLNLTSKIVSSAIILKAETDAAALLAEAVFRYDGAQSSGFELWDRNRRIRRHFNG
jgi:hypothetical protein